MTRKTETEPMLRGRAAHRRTQSDYMGALLDRVTLEAWGEVIDATVARAKDGDAQARAFLAAYLVGKPDVKAPAPLEVTAARISGNDALADKLAKPAIDRVRYPTLTARADAEATIRDAVAAELPAHIEPQP
ncbi:MAG: hypothetical protein J0H27_15500 [Xanthomonadales bacterium]|nr:hypothetical protein [Xanthomonadales bacterium]ODU91592.1 MAG: hypothetical protein ABT18_15595 [Rhodanobacter sp. SCN 66-43]OJY86001.1 MAG: hypothetical protein BGP23_04925 [Xanthomonadales bacterium 66-474]